MAPRKRKISSVAASDEATSSSAIDDAHVRQRIGTLLERHGIPNGSKHTTKAGWCLREGLCHIGSLNNQALLPRILHHGLPTFYLKKQQDDHKNMCRHEATQDLKDPKTCFQSLCRIVAGQFVSGKSAQAAWSRLLNLADGSNGGDLTPELILEHRNDVDRFQKAAGVTKAKARSILDLAQHFSDGRLSDEFLQSSYNSEDDLRKALLRVWGIGEWSCDMFLLFYLERPNILPLGDLGVRKGIASQFFAKPSKPLCPKKDLSLIHSRLENYAPYFSLLSYYMWRVADTPTIPPANQEAQGTGESDKKLETTTQKHPIGATAVIDEMDTPEESPSFSGTPRPRKSPRKRGKTVTP